MEVLTLSTSTFIKDELIVTIGQFDGIHKAHQELIKKTVLAAKNQNAKSAAKTFYTDNALAYLREQYLKRGNIQN